MSLVLVALFAPVVVAAVAAVTGWRRAVGYATVAAALVILACGAALAAQTASTARIYAGGLLRVDGLTVTMLIVIGAVAAIAAAASIGYLDAEFAAGHTTVRRAHAYAVLLPAFVAAMTLAVLANNLGVMWVAIEATTIATAFLVGHHPSRAALEATWKYVVICSVGIALAFLGTVVLNFGGRHAGISAGQSLRLDSLVGHAGQLDPAVTHLAAGLLLLGYGAKVGLVPFHTWLADAHSQAPAPVSALMSGVLLPVAFCALLRVKTVADAALGNGFFRNGLLTVGLLTVAVAAFMLVVQTDVKRMLAYSSMENMGLLALAAAAGTRLAIAALLLHVLAHGLGKAVLFLAAGQLQMAHGSTAIADIGAVIGRSKLLAVALGVGLAVLLGMPPFAMFASELSMARGLAGAHLAWSLAVALALLVIAFAALVRNGARLLLGTPAGDPPAIVIPATTVAALVAGVCACLLLGITAGPLAGVFHAAADVLGAVR